MLYRDEISFYLEIIANFIKPKIPIQKCSNRGIFDQKFCSTLSNQPVSHSANFSVSYPRFFFQFFLPY